MSSSRRRWASLRAAGRGGTTAIALGLATLLATLLVACVPSRGEAFVKPFYAAKRAYNAGRYAEAAQHYQVAADNARRVKDRDEALFLKARMYERLEQWRQAQQCYLQLIAASPHGPRTGRAVFEVAELEIVHGDADKGWAALHAAIMRYPNHGSARRALRRLVEYVAAREGEQALRTMLQRDGPQLKGSEAEQQVEYEYALSLQRAGQLVAARDALLATARAHPYPSGNLTDDALWVASEIDEQLGRYRAAIAALREMLAVREVSIPGYSYERPRFPYAQMRIAELYRDKLDDAKQARREFRRVYQEHSECRIADDAMWQEALLANAAGDGDESCDLTEQLRESYPDSRYVRCLQQLCPSALAATNRRPCPRYILREIHPPNDR